MYFIFLFYEWNIIILKIEATLDSNFIKHNNVNNLQCYYVKVFVSSFFKLCILYRMYISPAFTLEIQTICFDIYISIESLLYA